MGQVGGDALALLVVGRVHRDELAARGAVGVLGVALVQQVPARHELEGDTVPQAVLADGIEDRLRVVEPGRDVDLPALGRQRPVQGRRASQSPVRWLVQPSGTGRVAAR
ncbi:hypothetical protein ACFQ60_05090 [Streptomyces zhihengii]